MQETFILPWLPLVSPVQYTTPQPTAPLSKLECLQGHWSINKMSLSTIHWFKRGRKYVFSPTEGNFTPYRNFFRPFSFSHRQNFPTMSEFFQSYSYSQGWKKLLQPDLNQCPLGWESSTLTPRPSLHILMIKKKIPKDIKDRIEDGDEVVHIKKIGYIEDRIEDGFEVGHIKKIVYIEDRIEDGIEVRHKIKRQGHRKKDKRT